MESLKLAILVCLVGVALGAEKKDTTDIKDAKERKNRDIGAILGSSKLNKGSLDRGYLPPTKYYPGGNYAGGVCDCRTGAPINGGYPGSYPGGPGSYPGGPGGYPGGYPGGPGGYPGGSGGYPGGSGGYPGGPGGYPGGPGGIGGGAIGGGAIGGAFDDTVQVYPRPGSGIGPSGLGPNGLGPSGLGPNGISSSSGAFGVSSSYGVPSGPGFNSKGGPLGPSGSGFGGPTGSGSGGFIGGSSGIIGGGAGVGPFGGPRPGLDGPLPLARPGSSIGVASSSYTSSGSVGFIPGGDDGYNYNKPSIPFP